MQRILTSWIGRKDLDATRPGEPQPGPLLSTVEAQSFDRLCLLYNYPEEEVTTYLELLRSKTTAQVEATPVRLTSPIHFGDIYQVAYKLLDQLRHQVPECRFNILLSPGTPAMQAIWILLGKTQFPSTFWQASWEQGVQKAVIPFDIAAEFLPGQNLPDDQQLSQIVMGHVPVDAAFDDILTQNPQMQRLKAQATVLADRQVPVLIYGETGTGKELFATAIHNASPRAGQPFVPVNCGAIPAELIDSTLFGHVKGAFTGANADRQGYFEAADGGTLFLDEFGELPLNVQVRLLRALQSGEITPVGSTEIKRVDVRILAATNRNLIEEVAAGRFREDLFYRIAVGVLYLPPLRERQGDLLMLADKLLNSIVAKTSEDHKEFSAEAKNLILRHPWRGNIRELASTLQRATLWSQGSTVSMEELKGALFQMPEQGRGILDRDLTQGLDLQRIIDEVVKHYIPRALATAGGNKTKAAEILNLTSYQTLNNWIRRHGVE